MALGESSTRNCGTCIFFRRGGVARALGVCRARPPVPMLVHLAQDNAGRPLPVISTYWPQVPDTEWCGDWERRPDMGALDAAALANAEAEGSA